MTLIQRYHAALDMHRNGEFTQAEASYRQLLAAAGLNTAQQADLMHLLGVLCHQTGRSEEAIRFIHSALALDQHNPDYLNNLGLALRATGQYELAIDAYQRGLQIAPKDIDLQTNLANVLQQLARYQQATAYYRQILKATPQDTDIRQALVYALQQLGNQHQQAGSYQQAAASYQEAQRYAAADAALYYNLGNAQRELGLPVEAATSYRKALVLNPDDADTHNNLGNVLRETGQLSEAIASYRKALLLNPQLYHAQVHLTHQRQHICDWHASTDGLPSLDTEIQTIRDWVRHVPTAQISPFAFLSMPGTSAEEQRLCANNWLANRYTQVFSQAAQLGFFHNKTQKSQLKIGYISADFRLHPLASLISELIEQHDRDHFHVSAYSYGVDDKSAERQRLQSAFDAFVDIRNLSPIESAKRIHADQIDILVDLTGFTQSSRSSIAALRPAPINVSWLGFPGTMGGIVSRQNAQSAEHALFDYLISDISITPRLLPHQQHWYAEKLAVLPDCYQPNDKRRPMATVPSRQECHLPEQGFVFCCFNQTYKITPDVFALWMRLLEIIPGSVLWLLECNTLARENLIREATLHGIDAHRLIFAPRVPMSEHLARQALADLFLDTLPYNAHTTASDALWMGLPLVTCDGDTFAARVAASILRAAHIPELVVSSLAEYEALVISLATQPSRLEAIKARLRRAPETLPLFNTERFARHLESAYWHMWQRWHDGLPPESFEIKPAADK